MPNKLSQFWQELKRRNVVRVVTVYIAASLAILELVSNISEPFGLPDWTLKLVFVILVIGLILAIILSWIYDVHPGEGMVKTEPDNKVKAEQTPKSSSGWKIASYISFVVIVGLIILNVIPREGKKEILDKSIAVLPFINESQDQENGNFINGIMDELVMNLQSIKDLRVPGRTSTEQYRNDPKSIPEIAKEMNVAYVVESSGQRYGDKIRLRVWLVEGASDKRIWSDFYDEVIEGTEDKFRIQSEIAQSIAAELQAVITPDEMELIDKVPTTSLLANEFYQMGREEYIKFLLDVRDREALTRAQEYYLKALEYDSTYAKACAGVAMTYYSKLSARGKIDRIYSDGYLEDNAFDTVSFWANKALHFDKQLPEAYHIRGNYYFETGQREKAEQDYRKAIQLNPNYWEAYFGLGYLYSNSDPIKYFENLYKAASLVRGPELSYILSELYQAYALTGNIELGEPFIAQYLNLTQDSLLYYFYNHFSELYKFNTAKSHYWLLKAYAYDSTNPIVINYLAESYINMDNFEDGLKYYKQSVDINKTLGRIFYNRLQRVGYSFSLAGNKEEADYYLDRAEEISKSMIRLNRPWSYFGLAQYDLATIYACKGEKSKAMEILRDLHQRSPTPFMAAFYMQWDPMMDEIRDDPEFQQIKFDLGMKTLAEINTIRQWLEENDML